MTISKALLKSKVSRNDVDKIARKGIKYAARARIKLLLKYPHLSSISRPARNIKPKKPVIRCEVHPIE